MLSSTVDTITSSAVSASPSQHWRPLVEGALAEHVLAIVARIADALARPFTRPPTPELHGGDSGKALFLAYWAVHTKRSADADAAFTHADRAGDSLATHRLDESLYAGFTGVAWAVDHVYATLCGEDDDDTSDAVDDAIARRLAGTRHFDVISGLAGLGIRALQRRHRAPALLDAILERLADYREPGDPVWRTPVHVLSAYERERAPAGFHNVGVAHGIPGVVGVLAHAVAVDIGGARMRDMLRDAIDWLLAQRLDVGPSRFPYWVAPQQSPVPARAGWCYGDAGVAATLLLGARALGSRAYERDAIELARFAAARPFESTAVQDAGLCHGAAGLMHIFARIHHATGDERCRLAAREWLDHTLSFSGANGIAGFAPHGFAPGSEPYEANASGFLSGVAGIGLALLAAATTTRPAWDRLLLADIDAEPT